MLAKKPGKFCGNKLVFKKKVPQKKASCAQSTGLLDQWIGWHRNLLGLPGKIKSTSSSIQTCHPWQIMQKTTEYRIVSCVCVHPFLAHSHAYQGVGMHTVMDLNGWWWWFQWPHPSETNYHLPPFDDRSTWKHHYHQKFQAEANFNQLRGGECWNLKSPGKAEPYPEKWLSKHLGIPPRHFWPCPWSRGPHCGIRRKDHFITHQPLPFHNETPLGNGTPFS